MFRSSTVLKTAAASVALFLTTACSTYGEEVVIEAADETVAEAQVAPAQPTSPARPASIRPAAIDIARYDEAIAQFKAADAADAPPACATLFTGSSSIRFWNSLARDFPDRKVINRGFGGSTIAEVNHYFDDIVAPYKPAAIVFYAGENDINAGQSPDKAYTDFEAFMTMKEAKLGTTPVWYISAKPSKLRFDQTALQTQLNKKIEALARVRNDLAYIDVVGPMLKPDGSPKDIFVSDDLHMTPEGYAIWTPIVKAALDKRQAARAPGC